MSARRAFGAIVAAFALTAACAPARATTIDSFDSVAGWRAMPADGVSLAISGDAGRVGSGMRLDFDFHGHGGYAIARRDGNIELPDNFEFTFWLRATAPVNTLEFKLIDPSGDNVWWSTKRDYEFPTEWRRISIPKRQIEFAWGPKGGGPVPSRIGAIEIVVTAGSGGSGSVWIDELEVNPVEISTAPWRPAAGPWKSDGDGARSYTLDLGGQRDLGGLVLDWDPKDFATDYTVAVSRDNKEWETGRRVSGSNGGRDFVFLPDTSARYVRLDLAKSSRGRGYSLVRAEAKPAAWAGTTNEFFASIAHESPRGEWPRYFLGEQSYWTIVGAMGDPVEALVSEDGAVELGDSRISLEPFVWIDGRLITWGDVSTTHSLQDGVLPIPSVEWASPHARLRISAWVTGGSAGSGSTLSVRYQLDAPDSARLYVAVRPFQVNPSWQFLQRRGGVGKISSLSWDGKQVLARAFSTTAIVPRNAPAAFGASSFDGGNIVEQLRVNRLPSATSVSDEFGFASGAFRFDKHDVTIDVALGSNGVAPKGVDAVAEEWRNSLHRARIDVGDSRITSAILSNLAYILVNRDGAAIQPGSRSYQRSWIRDGSLTSVALLRLGHEEEVREFIRWYAKHQYADGKIPCCVGSAGSDPVPENDSNGEFIFLIGEYYRYTDDRALVEELWPQIGKTVSYIDALRHQRMTREYSAPDKRVLYGLMPESISHEGYSAKPMHSYWDDLFALRGLDDAVFLAKETGHANDAKRWETIAVAFRIDLTASIALAMKQHAIGYIPGCAELGDFDATSTTVFLSPGTGSPILPDALRKTFEKYWTNFTERRDGTHPWDAYTPYELRAVGALVRLGERQRAHEALRFFLADQRPSGWNEWAEVVWRDERAPRFIGDMPHTWVGSDFIRSALDMLAWERGADHTLVLASGVLPEWVEKGVHVEQLRTEYGELSYSMTMEAGAAVVRIDAGLRMPPGGIAVVSPFDGRETIVRSLPAEIRIKR